MVAPDPRYPLTVPITWRRAVSENTNEYGDPVYRYEDEPISVFAVVEGGQEPATASNPFRVAYDLKIYAPSDYAFGPHDQLIYRRVTYQIDGVPSCYDANPWWSPGLCVIRAKLIDG